MENLTVNVDTEKNLSRSSEEPIHRKICTGRMYRTTVCNPHAFSDSGLKDRSLLFSSS